MDSLSVSLSVSYRYALSVSVISVSVFVGTVSVFILNLLSIRYYRYRYGIVGIGTVLTIPTIPIRMRGGARGVTKANQLLYISLKTTFSVKKIIHNEILS